MFDVPILILFAARIFNGGATMAALAIDLQIERLNDEQTGYRRADDEK